MAKTSSDRVISTILKHDAKVTSYKIALLRAINDVVLSFPDLEAFDRDIAVPLRELARFWIAYYWPFVKQSAPILQGPRARLGNGLRNDMAFREELTVFRAQWENAWGATAKPSDGFLAINELRIPRKRRSYPSDLLEAYINAILAISKTIRMPIRYAGPGQWSVFDRPLHYRELGGAAISIPGTQDKDICLVVPADLWRTFQQVSPYVEALCIHEWCLFTEKVDQRTGIPIDRGRVYRLLTDRPDNRRPLTWERNQVDLLLMEGIEFICPWTGRQIHKHANYDMDHVLPLSIYPINELWNLVPSDPNFNSNTKRDRLPSLERLIKAEPYLCLAYTNYQASKPLAQAMCEDVESRFVTVQTSAADFPIVVAKAVISFVDQVASFRNLARF
jgi:hypothetical protein